MPFSLHSDLVASALPLSAQQPDVQEVGPALQQSQLQSLHPQTPDSQQQSPSGQQLEQEHAELVDSAVLVPE